MHEVVNRFRSTPDRSGPRTGLRSGAGGLSAPVRYEAHVLARAAKCEVRRRSSSPCPNRPTAVPRPTRPLTPSGVQHVASLRTFASFESDQTARRCSRLFVCEGSSATSCNDRGAASPPKQSRAGPGGLNWTPNPEDPLSGGQKTS